jgi:hypothetical protein
MKRKSIMHRRFIRLAATTAGIWLAGSMALAQTEPTIIYWKFGEGAKGSSQDAEVHAQVSQYDADVTEVWHNTSNVYVKAESIPSHDIGPWGNRNVYPTAQDNTWVLRRVPQTPGGMPGPPLPAGTIGIFVNGVQLFTWSDGTSYENEDVWHNNAVIARTDIDDALGHPAPGGMGGMRPEGASAEGHTHWWTDDPRHSHANAPDARGFEKVSRGTLMAAGVYHYHTQPPALRAQLGDDGTAHSPILGFAFDGNPIYGPYGFANTDGSGGVRRMVSSYPLRSIVNRNTLADGTDLTGSGLEGPPINATYPLGYFAEDYEFLMGSGDLDEYNGRQCVTPEYPSGVYAYFATIDGSGDSAFPYTIGPDAFRGMPIMANLGPTGGQATIPMDAVQFTGVPVELSAFSLE